MFVNKKDSSECQERTALVLILILVIPFRSRMDLSFWKISAINYSDSLLVILLNSGLSTIIFSVLISKSFMLSIY